MPPEMMTISAPMLNTPMIVAERTREKALATLKKRGLIAPTTSENITMIAAISSSCRANSFFNIRLILLHRLRTSRRAVQARTDSLRQLQAQRLLGDVLGVKLFHNAPIT